MRQPQKSRVDAFGVGEASGIVEPADHLFLRGKTAGGKRLEIGVVPDLDMRGFRSPLGLQTARKIDHDLIGGKRAKLLRAVCARRGGDLDQPRGVQFFDMRGDRAVGKIEPLCKMRQM